jgi:hypothetical protein
LGFLAAEEKMLQFSNLPELTPEKFEKLLPYAMVLDVDEIWGAKFQRMLSLSSAAQQYHPTWYTGGMIQRASFAHMLNSPVCQIPSVNPATNHLAKEAVGLEEEDFPAAAVEVGNTGFYFSKI